MKHICIRCGETVPSLRADLGYKTCLPCGEQQAKQRKFTIAPLPKSNYMVFSDMSLLKGLNSSHKGGR
jgi:hypothetical protein